MINTENYNSPGNLELTATHEAGHAIVGLLHGFPLEFIHLQSVELGNGTVGEAFCRWQKGDAEEFSLSSFGLDHRLEMTMAGFASESIYTGEEEFFRYLMSLDGGKGFLHADMVSFVHHLGSDDIGKMDEAFRSARKLLLRQENHLKLRALTTFLNQELVKGTVFVPGVEVQCIAGL